MKRQTKVMIVAMVILACIILAADFWGTVGPWVKSILAWWNIGTLIVWYLGMAFGVVLLCLGGILTLMCWLFPGFRKYLADRRQRRFHKRFLEPILKAMPQKDKLK